MRCWPALPLLLLGLAWPACAQRGSGAHGGFAAHPAGSFGGSSRGFSPGPRFSASPRSGLPVTRYGSSGTRYGGPVSRYGPQNRPATARYGSRYGFGNGVPANRPTFFARSSGADRGFGNGRFGQNRGFGQSRYGFGCAFPVFNPFLGAYLDWPLDSFWDDNNDIGYDPSLQADLQAPYPDTGTPYASLPPSSGDGPSFGPEPQADSQNGPTPYAPAPLLNAPAYAPRQSASFASASAGSAPAEEDAITLIYKDGRPSEQVRNYALTRETLYITGRRIREIPLSELDLPATERVNQAAGLSFQLP